MSIPDRPLMPFRPLAWVTVKHSGVKGQVKECCLHEKDIWTFWVETNEEGRFSWDEFSADELE